MENIKQILEKIESDLEQRGFENILGKTEEFMGQHPVKYLEDFNQTIYHTAPELLDQNMELFKYRVKHVLCAMSHITLDQWTPEFMNKTGPEIFKPLLEILNN